MRDKAVNEMRGQIRITTYSLNRTYIEPANLPILREAGFESGSTLNYREENENLTDVKNACNFG